MFALRRSLTGLLVFVCLASSLFAGFQSTETYLVAVGRAPGQFGAQIYSTVWATNLTGAPNSFTVYFLKQGQANTSPASFSDTLAPGETKIYENIVESKFGLTSAIGAARIVSAGEILVSERIYNQPSGADLGNTEGFFFAGVPRGFSISSGQSASIQGVNQGGSENFRSNFILVETGGASTTVNIQVFDANGTLLGQKPYPLQPYEQLQGNVGEIVPSIATTNGRITATVTGGTGSALLAGAQVANESQDASGFEMSFRDDLLGGGGSGLTSVIHDGTLIGNGTVSTPLGVNPAAVVTSLNGLHGALTLAAGSNVTITPSGSTLTIASTGGGGGLALPFSGTTSATGYAFDVTSTATTGISGAIQGNAAGDETGVLGESSSGFGVFGQSSTNAGVVGSSSSRAGVSGQSDSGTGVEGVSNSGDGVIGFSLTLNGVHGRSTATGVNGSAIWAESAVTNGIALYATNHGSDATVVATNASNGIIYKGFSNGGTEVFEVNANGVSLPTISNAVVTTTSVCVNGTTLVLCNASSLRFKKEIEPMGDASLGLLTLRPVTFHYKEDPADQAPLHYGLIAEEVAKVYPDLILRDRDGKVSGVRYEELSSLLLNEFQKEHAEVAALTQKAAQLEQANQALEFRLAEEERTQAARLAVLERKLSLIEQTERMRLAANR